MHFVLLLFVFCLCLLALSDDVLGVDFFVFILFEFKLISVDNFFPTVGKCQTIVSSNTFLPFISLLSGYPSTWNLLCLVSLTKLRIGFVSSLSFCSSDYVIRFDLSSGYLFLFLFFAKSDTMLGVSSECFISFLFPNVNFLFGFYYVHLSKKYFPSRESLLYFLLIL